MKAGARFGRRRKYLTALVCAFACSLPVFSQSVKAKDDPCAKAVSTMEMTSCTWKAWQAADAALGNYFSLVTIELDDSEVSALKKAQDAWVQYRELNCKAVRALYEGGTAGEPAYNSCMETMAQERLKNMKAIYGWRMSK